jgi:hypothetical protein
LTRQISKIECLQHPHKGFHYLVISVLSQASGARLVILVTWETEIDRIMGEVSLAKIFVILHQPGHDGAHLLFIPAIAESINRRIMV